MKQAILIAAATAAALAGVTTVLAQGNAQPPANPAKMSFFITSTGSGQGGNLGGLAGADKLCKDRATAAGAPASRVWRAYLSATAANGQPAVNARDRIGKGPWYNARGEQVGRDVADLHREGSPINKATGLDERGNSVNGRGDTPNKHDIMTGSNRDGTLAGDLTCGNWTSNGAGQTRVGHFDRTGGGDYPTSWNSAHSSKSCSQPDLISTGGDGLIFCFAER
ncbi:hypothetical protein [Sphingomonas quercus]|uniref:Lectin n=1 Tax=Sphingomonas quercus TaxID=2842451 RepID=A0ABS6BNX8_9SPHN|nr:hypothetical protein [Sphingomonas quercus]MBU3079496.1 hypothetical protein [Sphingomonas quercus]